MKPIALALLTSTLICSCHKNPKESSHQRSAKEDTTLTEIDSTGDSTAPSDTINPQSPEGRAIAKIQKFAKNLDKKGLASMIDYPLDRGTLPAIKNRAELLEKFDEVFDDSLISILDTGSWSPVGWRGVMVNNGEVWISYGDSLITTINYESSKATVQKDKIDSDRKKGLHPSLQNCTYAGEPYLLADHRIEIDGMNSETAPARLLIWGKDQKREELPLYIFTGTEEVQGSVGDSYYELSNDSLTATLSVNSMGESDTFNTSYLEVFRNETSLFKDSARSIQ